MKENENIIAKTIDVIEANIKIIDSNFSKAPIYKTGKEAGGFLGNLIDNTVDYIANKI